MGRERVREREREHAHTWERERERERERECACTWERESLRKCFGSSVYMFFPPPGPVLCKFGLVRSAVCSVLPEVFTLVLGPSLSFSHRHFGLLFPILPT